MALTVKNGIDHLRSGNLRRRGEIYRARSDRMPTCRSMLFAVVADKLDLYLAERMQEKEKCSFYCALNQCT